jgi:hypothetical protein
MQVEHRVAQNRGGARVERQIDQVETFLNALDSNSLVSLNISFKHVVECDYAVYDQLTEEVLEIDVLKRYLRKHLATKLAELRNKASAA